MRNKAFFIKDLNLFKIIYVLQEANDSLNTGDLANKSRISRKNITRYLKKMEEMDLISRRPLQKGKKRFLYNTLTKKGNNFEIPYKIKKYIRESILA